MKTERYSLHWIVIRGSRPKRQYFSFFVDYDKDSWSVQVSNAARFPTEDSAKEALQELKRRGRLRRQERERVTRP